MESEGGMMSFVLSYPNALALNNQVFLGYSLGNIELGKEEDIEVVKSFKMFILHYMASLNLHCY